VKRAHGFRTKTALHIQIGTTLSTACDTQHHDSNNFRSYYAIYAVWSSLYTRRPTHKVIHPHTENIYIVVDSFEAESKSWLLRHVDHCQRPHHRRHSSIGSRSTGNNPSTYRFIVIVTRNCFPTHRLRRGSHIRVYVYNDVGPISVINSGRSLRYVVTAAVVAWGLRAHTYIHIHIYNNTFVYIRIWSIILWSFID